MDKKDLSPKVQILGSLVYHKKLDICIIYPRFRDIISGFLLHPVSIYQGTIKYCLSELNQYKSFKFILLFWFQVRKGYRMDRPHSFKFHNNLPTLVVCTANLSIEGMKLIARSLAVDSDN